MTVRLGDTIVPSVFVRDLDDSSRFYERIGFSAAGHHPGERDPVWAEICCGNAVIELYTDPPHGTRKTPILSGTLYLYPDDVDALAAELADRVAFEWGPETMPYGMREFAVRDPNGYLIAFRGEAEPPVDTRLAAEVSG